MSDQDPIKSKIDQFFGIADSALGKVHEAIKQPPSPQPSTALERWEQGFEETTWSVVNFATPGPASSAWHAFRMGSMTTVCGKACTSSEIVAREVLSHGKTIAACSSCIIGVSK